MSVPRGCPVSTVDWSNQSTGSAGPLGATSQWHGEVPRGCQLGTGRRRAGANSGDHSDGRANGRAAGFVHRGSFRAREGAFERANDAASNGGRGTAGLGRKRRRRRGLRRRSLGVNRTRLLGCFERARWLGGFLGAPEA